MHKSHATDCRLIVPSCQEVELDPDGRACTEGGDRKAPGEDEVIGLAWNERSSVELPCPETDALAPGLVLCVRHAS